MKNPTRTSRNQKDNLQLIEEPSGFGFISWVFLSVGKSLCFFCKDLTCNRLISEILLFENAESVLDFLIQNS
jgi:hypothetical protein